MFAPGSVSVTAGSVLSSVTVIGLLVKLLPALSVVIARRSYPPSGSCPFNQEAVYGAVVAVEMSFQIAVPVAAYWNLTDATPEPPVSAESAVNVTGLCTKAAGAGEVREPVGATLSMVTVTGGASVVFPTRSVALAISVKT